MNSKNDELGYANVYLIYSDKTVPDIPEIPAKIKYKVLIFLWFVEKSPLLINLKKLSDDK